MAKRKPMGVVRLSSDELASQQGRWVEIDAFFKAKHIPFVDALELKALTKKGLPKKKVQSQKTVFDLLAVFVTDWNWKDFDGKPYPKPAGKPEVFAELHRKEYLWIWNKVWEAIGGDLDIPKAKGTPS